MADSFDPLSSVSAAPTSKTSVTPYLLLGGAAVAGVLLYLKSKGSASSAPTIGPDAQAAPLAPSSVPGIPEMSQPNKIAFWKQLANSQLAASTLPNYAAVTDRTTPGDASTSALRDVMYRNQSTPQHTVMTPGVPPMPGSPPVSQSTVIPAQAGRYVLDLNVNDTHTLWFPTLEEINQNLAGTASQGFTVFLKPDEWTVIQSLAGAGYQALVSPTITPATPGGTAQGLNETPPFGFPNNLPVPLPTPGTLTGWPLPVPSFPSLPGLPSVPGSVPNAPPETPQYLPLAAPREITHDWKIALWRGLFGKAFIPFVGDPALPYLGVGALGDPGTLAQQAPQTVADNAKADPSLALLMKADDQSPNDSAFQPFTFWFLPEAQAVETARSTAPGYQWLIVFHGNGEWKSVEDEASQGAGNEGYRINPAPAGPTTIPTQGGGV